jgi:hypothetical protein
MNRIAWIGLMDRIAWIGLDGKDWMESIGWNGLDV